MNNYDKFYDLFRGSDRIYGKTTILDEIDPRTGKRKANCRSVTTEPITNEVWQKHLIGQQGCGCSPINKDSMVRWGAIDIDGKKHYSEVKVEDIVAMVSEKKLPVVPCLSKSRGAHLYLFLTDWTSARNMVAALESIASVLGFGAAEIFPKQVYVDSSEGSNDYGNWINMPYFGGDRSTQYALDQKGERLSMAQFFDHVEKMKISPDKLEFFQSLGDSKEVPFPEYPPCLNSIYTEKNETARNVTLSNLAVAMKKEFEVGWQEHLEKANTLFVNPLPNKEVANIIKSHEKKDYHFQCSKEPLCHYCNTAICRSRKFGIGADGAVPGFKSLTKVNTSPPLWYLDMHTPDGECVRICLETDELRKPDLYEKRVMEMTNSLPLIYTKKSDWYEVVSQLMDNMSIIDVPKELTPEGQFVETVKEFLVNRTVEKSTYSTILKGNVHKDDKFFYFRHKDLKLFIQNSQFTDLKPSKQVSILCSELGARKEFTSIDSKGVNIIKLPITFDDKQPNFKPKEPEQHLDF